MEDKSFMEMLYFGIKKYLIKMFHSQDYRLGVNNPAMIGVMSQGMKDDPRWSSFSDLLPFMGSSAGITRMPPGSKMAIHIDRTWRPIAIYFPIFGNSSEVISRHYNATVVYDKAPLGFPQFIPESSATEVSQHTDGEYAALTNNREFHDVRNNSSIERMAFGWNFKDASLTFDQCADILRNLGYCE
jgi:hypothetical protein